MSRKLANTLDIKGLENGTLCKLVTKLHRQAVEQSEIAKILTEKGYTTTKGGEINVDTVRRFERTLGLPQRGR